MPTISDITGLSATVETVKADSIDTLAREYDRDAILSSLLGKLNDTYTLFYADYRDMYDSVTIAKFINANDPAILDESIDEWRMDGSYDAVQYVIKDTYDEDERAAIELLDLFDDLRNTIEERDDSEPVRDLLRNSSSHFCFSTILPAEEEGSIESYQYTQDAEAEYKKIADAADIYLKPNRKAIEELYQNGASYGTAALVWFFVIDPLDYYKALIAQYKSGKDDIMVTLHAPHLALRDSWNGSGHDIETKRIVTVPLSSIKSDEKGNGYSYAKDVCGLVRAPYEVGFTF